MNTLLLLILFVFYIDYNTRLLKTFLCCIHYVELYHEITYFGIITILIVLMFTFVIFFISVSNHMHIILACGPGEKCKQM